MFSNGPWEVWESRTCFNVAGPITDKEREDICVGMTEDNARLIAAAPEMYELLNKVYNLGLSSRYPELEAGIREMLNKIEGR